MNTEIEITPDQAKDALDMLRAYYQHAWGATVPPGMDLTATSVVTKLMQLPDINRHLARVMTAVVKA